MVLRDVVEQYDLYHTCVAPLLVLHGAGGTLPGV